MFAVRSALRAPLLLAARGGALKQHLSLPSSSSSHIIIVSKEDKSKLDVFKEPSSWRGFAVSGDQGRHDEEQQDKSKEHHHHHTPHPEGVVSRHSQYYTLLGLAHTSLAATAFVAPTALATLFFSTGAVFPQGFEAQALTKLFGAGLAIPAASCFALKQEETGEEEQEEEEEEEEQGQGAKESQLQSQPSSSLSSSQETTQRLQLGLMGVSTSTIALHLLYSPQLPVSSILAGATVMGLTFYVPYQHYKKQHESIGGSGGSKFGEIVKSYVRAVPHHFKINNAQSALYSLLTPTIALAGASYLFMPSASLAAVFGYIKGVDSFFLWQVIGGGLMTAAPAATFSLKEMADAGRLAEPMAKALNYGLLAAAAGHLSVFLPMLAAGQGGGVMLEAVVGTWVLALLTSSWGLVSSVKKKRV
jgi:hypothetical protein